jgi:hypothetical protein
MENFEKIDIGSIPNEWELSQIGSNDLVYVQDNFVISEEKTLYIKESGGDNTNIWLESEKFEATDLEYSFKFRIVGVLQARAVFSLLNNLGEVCIMFNCRAGDNWRYNTYDGYWENIPNLPTPLSGQIYNIKIVIDSKNGLYNIIVNEVESGWLKTSKNLDEIAQISFSTNYNYPSEFWIDDILIEQDKTPKKEGVITIRKIVEWGYKTKYTDELTFKFQTSWGDQITLKNGEQFQTNLESGVHIVSEVLENGWDLREISIEDPSGGSYKQNPRTGIIDIVENDNVTITFVNTPPDFVIEEAPFGTLSIILIMMLALLILNQMDG